jgi:hypothetical protein
LFTEVGSDNKQKLDFAGAKKIFLINGELIGQRGRN